jgi:hypothetical protein
MRFVNAALKGDIKASAFILSIEPEIERNAEPVKRILKDMSLQEAADAYAQMLKR